MIKSAFVTKKPSANAVIKPSGKAVEDRLSPTVASKGGRFPPVENALTQIVRNKRFTQTLNNV